MIEESKQDSEMDDTKKLVRRQELLARARRARNEWLEACRLRKCMVPRREESTSPQWWRRACEIEVIAESSEGTFDSAGRMTQFLSDLVDEEPGYPLVPLAGDEAWTQAVEAKVAAKCASVLEAVDGLDADDLKAETQVDILIEDLKQPERADLVRSIQHFVDAELTRNDDDDDDDDEINGKADDAEAKKHELLLRRKVAADLLFASSDVEDEENIIEEDEPKSFTSALNDPIAGRIRTRVEAFAKRVAGTLKNTSHTTVQTLLYRRLARKLWIQDKKNDTRLYARFEALEEVLDFTHLGARQPEDLSTFDQGVVWLGRLKNADRGASPAPLDFVRCLAVTARRFTKAANKGDAEDLLPSFVIGIIRAKPPQPASIAAYLQRYVETTSGAQGYVVTNLLGALDFLSNLDTNMLDHIDPIELRRRLDLADAKAKQTLKERTSVTLVSLTPEDKKNQLENKHPVGRREVSAREVRALRLARQAEFAVHASTFARYTNNKNSSYIHSPASSLLSDYHALLAQVDALSPPPKPKIKEIVDNYD
uniref:VPS9 domain-containing protein n=1 Tax=Aureoumbra lagunensis TaxID=44058 RepID=A0A7S3JTQ5_9STRA